jgi:hypothetical protein
MNEEQLQRTIEFLLQSQADFASKIAIIREMQKEFQKERETEDKNFQVKINALTDTVHNLALLGRDLLEVEQIHSRRLDRLEGMHPH